MQSGRGGLLHCFKKFITDVDGEETAFVSVVSCGNSGAVMNCIIGGGQTDRMQNVILPKGSYQVRSELELELESECDNGQETIWLQLMCCAP